MARPLRVLILNERDPGHPRAGGAEIHVSETFRRLAARGHRIEQLATSYPGASERELVDGIEVRRLGRIRSYYPRVAPACVRATRGGRVDVVVECLNKLPFLSPLYARAPVLAISHHLFGEVAFEQVPWPVAAVVWSLERLIPRVYRSVPFVTISESSRDDLVARGVPRERVRVIHCGIRHPDLETVPAGRRPRRAVYVGRLEPYKRVDLMLRAAARLVSRFPDLELVVVGRGPERPRLEALAAELGLAERTRFAGFVSEAERDALVASGRVAVCPSPKEGWGLTVIEANAVGTPVVASDAPGLRDSVRPGVTGLLAPPGDARAFADAMGDLLDDRGPLPALAKNAREWSQRFDWDRSADAMEQALRAAARGRR